MTATERRAPHATYRNLNGEFKGEKKDPRNTVWRTSDLEAKNTTAASSDEEMQTKTR